MASAQLPAYLAAGAAFTAAVLSALNVVLLGRFSRRTERDRWRRDILLATLLDFLQAQEEHRDIVLRPHPETEERLDQIERSRTKVEEMVRLTGRLRLLAPDEVLKAAIRVNTAHIELARVLTKDADLKPPTKPAPEPEEARRCGELQWGFINAARDSLDIA